MSISALILILLGPNMILRNYKGTFLKTITLRAERIYTLILGEAQGTTENYSKFFLGIMV